MEKRGLINRLRQSADRRVVQIALTASANRLVAKIRASQVENCRKMLSKLDASERELLIRLVALIANS